MFTLQAGKQHGVAHTLRAEGFDASEDGTGRGTPPVPDVAPTMRAGGNHTGGDRPPGTDVDACESLIPEVANPLTQRMHKGINTTCDEGQTPIPIAFDCKGTEVQHCENVNPPLRLMCHSGSPANAGGHAAVAFDMRGREGGAMPEGPHDTANIRAADGGSSRSYVAQPMAVRRLTPIECERLQGFPDDFTRIPWRNKPADKCPDGPRYKALGNSMAVNVMGWIGRRIAEVCND